MKYTVDEALVEIKKRGSALRTRKLRKRSFEMVATGLIPMVTLLGVRMFHDGFPVRQLKRMSAGESFMSAAASGHVRMGVIAFATAVALTVVCIRYRDRHSR